MILYEEKKNFKNEGEQDCPRLLQGGGRRRDGGKKNSYCQGKKWLIGESGGARHANLHRKSHFKRRKGGERGGKRGNYLIERKKTSLVDPVCENKKLPSPKKEGEVTVIKKKGGRAPGGGSFLFRGEPLRSTRRTETVPIGKFQKKGKSIMWGRETHRLYRTKKAHLGGRGEALRSPIKRGRSQKRKEKEGRKNSAERKKKVKGIKREKGERYIYTKMGSRKGKRCSWKKFLAETACL